jgi:hypothetical protein
MTNSFYFAKFNISELDDRRIASLPDSAWRRYHECILLAKAEDNDGLLPDVSDMAWRLRITEETLLNDLSYLARAGLAELVPTDDGGEAWAIVDFAEHQGALSSTERSRLHRRGRRGTPSADEPETTPERTSNEGATKVQRNVAQNKKREEKKEKREREIPAPAPIPPIPFQPLPDGLQRQKEAHGITDPEPALTATAPPAVRLLHQFTGYWPGDDIAPALVDRLGDAPDEVALTRAVELWRLSGNKPTNWLGIIDWYDQLRRDPAWTPQARFRRDGPTGGRTPRPDEPLPAMKEIAPGVF